MDNMIKQVIEYEYKQALLEQIFVYFHTHNQPKKIKYNLSKKYNGKFDYKTVNDKYNKKLKRK